MWMKLCRYVDALRAQAKERLSQEKVELPPLCCCASSFWDSHPDTCANNCVFYNNPKGTYCKHTVSCFTFCSVLTKNVLQWNNKQQASQLLLFFHSQLMPRRYTLRWWAWVFSKGNVLGWSRKCHWGRELFSIC